MRWPKARCEVLGECIDKGMTGTQAGMVLHCSRSAAIGKAHALGWRFGEPRPEHLRTIPEPGARKRERTYKPAPRARKALYVNIDDATYDQVTARAKAGGATRAAVIRELIEWGLMA